MPATADTRPPPAAGPRSRNLRLWKTSEAWLLSSSAQAAGARVKAARRIETTTYHADFFICFSRVPRSGRRLRRPRIARAGIIPPLRVGKHAEVPRYAG